jgi:hypothetical protein
LYFEQFRVYRIKAIDLFLFSKALSMPGIDGSAPGGLGCGCWAQNKIERYSIEHVRV